MNNHDLNNFWQQYHRVMEVYEAYSAQTGLSGQELTVLDLVSREPGCTQKRLCELTRMPKQQVSPIVRKFASDGIFELRRNERDGRSKLILFTDKGKAFASPFLTELQLNASAALTDAHAHTHTSEDGAVITHSHAHGHAHTHENTKAVMDRLAKAIGHLEKVRDMVERGVDCSEVLIQLAAVKGSINNTGKIILKDHIEHCLVEAIECGDMATVEELKKAVDQFIK